MNFWLLLLAFDTAIIIVLSVGVTWLDKKCWDLLSVVTVMTEHITKLEEKVGLVHSDIQG